jgi:hypothetical protein
VDAGAAGCGSESGLAGVGQQQQTAIRQPQLASLAGLGACVPGAICVNKSAKASNGAKMILATFIQAVIFAAIPTIALKMNLSIQNERVSFEGEIGLPSKIRTDRKKAPFLGVLAGKQGFRSIRKNDFFAFFHFCKAFFVCKWLSVRIFQIIQAS